MATAGFILQGIGAEIEAYGQIRAGQIAKNIHEYNAQAATENAQQQAEALDVQRQMAERNAVVADQDALFATQVAAFNEQRFRTQFGRQQSQARANVGASGVTFEGSPLEVLASSAREAELDALSIRFSGELAARAKREEATLQRYNASLRVVEGKQVLRAGERTAILERYAGKEALLGGYVAGAATAIKGWGGAAAAQYNANTAGTGGASFTSYGSASPPT